MIKDGGFEAEVLADSVGPKGHRITTFRARYWRGIHDEILTHREFGRNSGSSRAIPPARFMAQVRDEPFIPLWWGKNEPGMVANAEVEDKAAAERWWLETRDMILERARIGNEMGLHKQIVNRIMQAWMWTETIITTTSMSNFRGLRVHEKAEPHCRKIATLLCQVYDESKPQRLEYGEWHLPYVMAADVVEDFNATDSSTANLIKLSVGRCARVSYLTHEGKRDVAKDIALHDQLMVQEPLHASPAEHQAQAVEGMQSSGNLRGEWLQYRKTFPNEYIR